MLSRGCRSIWAGRLIAMVVLGGTAVYLARVGLDKADKVASSIGLLIAVAALVAPYLLPQTTDWRGQLMSVHEEEPNHVEESGNATASGGGYANSGVDVADEDQGAAKVIKSGDARADDAGSIANTGITRRYK